MAYCSNCGRALPEGALFCPDCGERALDYSIMPPNVSPSHFNTGMTATSLPRASAPDAPWSAPPPPPNPEERNRSFARRRGLLLAVIAILAVLLLGTAFEAGTLAQGGGPSGLAVNSESNPLTGEQLYSAYATNHTQADASYTNKTVYIKDSLDFGAAVDSSTGRYYSTLDSGSVVLHWSSQSQVSLLYPGSTVLARCSVEGALPTPTSTYVLSLRNCDLIGVLSQSGTSSVSISMAND